MHVLNCPHHGKEALEFVRGRLEDADALRAEEHLESCSHCSTWYETAFSGEAFDTVDQTVQTSLSKTTLPRRNRHHRWLAAAAAVTLVVAGYGWWQHSETIVLDPVDHQPTIASLDFEGGMVVVDEGVTFVEDAQEAVAQHATDQDDGMLSKADLEDGGFGSWEIHT